jgi:DNA-binding LacI/PurR family transcriptional regulator
MHPDPRRGAAGSEPSDTVVTLIDVARAAGVTPAAVSYALSGKGTLSAATRARIRTCARDLGYRPNLVARSLVTRRTHTIGMIVGDIANPFYGVAAQTVERSASHAGYRVYIVSIDRNEFLGKEVFAGLKASRVDGLLAMGASVSADLVDSSGTAGMPVAWCMYDDDTWQLSPHVNVDYHTGGRLVAEHLLSLGHRRIGVITHGPKPGSVLHEHRLRVAGCRTGLAAGGCPLDPSLLAFGDSTVESGRAAGHALLTLPAPPTAIFATNDLMALGVLGAARDLGLPVPDALSIAGFDDIMAAAFAGPPLTTVRIDIAEVMTGAMALLLEMIAGKEPATPPLAPLHLLVRGSTGPVRSGGPVFRSSP